MFPPKVWKTKCHQCLHTKDGIPPGGTASEAEDVRVVCRDHHQCVLDAHQLQGLGDGQIELHTFSQGLPGFAIMVTMVYPATCGSKANINSLQ